MSEPTAPSDVAGVGDYRHIILTAASASLCGLVSRDEPGADFVSISNPGATCPICKRIWTQLRQRPRS